MVLFHYSLNYRHLELTFHQVPAPDHAEYRTRGKSSLVWWAPHGCGSVGAMERLGFSTSSYPMASTNEKIKYDLSWSVVTYFASCWRWRQLYLTARSWLPDSASRQEPSAQNQPSTFTSIHMHISTHMCVSPGPGASFPDQCGMPGWMQTGTAAVWEQPWEWKLDSLENTSLPHILSPCVFTLIFWGDFWFLFALFGGFSFFWGGFKIFCGFFEEAIFSFYFFSSCCAGCLQFFFLAGCFCDFFFFGYEKLETWLNGLWDRSGKPVCTTDVPHILWICLRDFC